MRGSSNLLTRFQRFAERNRLLPAGSRILVAVSGGADSVALLHLLLSLRGPMAWTLGVVHMNHLLRGTDAGEDEEFVRCLAKQHDLSCHITREDVGAYARNHGMGIEEAGRDLRYRFFEQVRVEHRYDTIVTGHTADDNAETVLFHLVRGSGVRGLAGIPLRRDQGHVVRPLLFARRQEIEAYVAAHAVVHRNDASNATTTYTRNYIRHRILPLIAEGVNPDVVQTLHRSSELFRELDDYLANAAGAALGLVTVRRTDEEVRLSLTSLLTFPTLIRQYLLQRAAEEFTGHTIGMGLTRNLMACLERQTGSWVPLPGGCAAWRDRDDLIMGRRQHPEPVSMAVEIGESYEVNGYRFAAEFLDSGSTVEFSSDGSCEYVDADHAGPGPFTLRSWKAGDAFVPLGMHGRKKLSDFFVDERIARNTKHRHLVLETPGGEIMWVCGLRIDERFKVGPATERVLQLTYTRIPDTPHG